MKRLAEILLLCVAVALLMGADTADARFQKIGSKIMCTCGSCSYMLLECNHVGCPNSTRMIAQLHALTGTGKLAGVEPQSDDEAILEWFRKNWGVTAVVEPAKHGLELWAWIMPPAALALGLLLVLLTLRKWKPRQAQALPQGAQLDPHLEDLRARARRETEI
jgi:cytochrome c-type biogenesis protein CcmH/NrfF